MLKLRRATPDDRQAIIELWQAEFGDAAEFIDDFCAWCGWEQIFLLFEDGRPCSMTAAPLMEVVLSGGETARAGYIYAFTTLREFRGRGFGRMLLNYADFCLQNQKADCAVLVPAMPSLFKYFASAGYKTAFSLWEETVAAEGINVNSSACGLRAVSPEEYKTIREERLKGVPHAASPLGMLKQQKKLCVASGADLYALELPRGLGCAAAVRQKDGSVILLELLVHAEDRNDALAALHGTLKAARYAVRMPVNGEAEGTPAKPFGVIKWYGVEWAEKWEKTDSGYFGLALD